MKATPFTINIASATLATCKRDINRHAGSARLRGGYFKLGASVPVRDIPGMGGAVIADLYALAPIPGMLAAPNLNCTRLREPVGGMAQIQGILTNHDHG